MLEKGLITGVPYLPAAIVMHFWSRDATRRGCRIWHIAIPALTGAISTPLALFMESPASTLAVITVTACSIFSALPNFWTLPTQFLTGASAAAAIALINTIGNVAGFSAGYITGAVRGVTGTYVLPMLIVGGGILLTFGNYVGDVLHFGQAKARLNAEGIPCELLAVTDDISSARALSASLFRVAPYPEPNTHCLLCRRA